MLRHPIQICIQRWRKGEKIRSADENGKKMKKFWCSKLHGKSRFPISLHYDIILRKYYHNLVVDGEYIPLEHLDITPQNAITICTNKLRVLSDICNIFQKWIILFHFQNDKFIRLSKTVKYATSIFKPKSMHHFQNELNPPPFSKSAKYACIGTILPNPPTKGLSSQPQCWILNKVWHLWISN